MLRSTAGIMYLGSRAESPASLHAHDAARDELFRFSATSRRPLDGEICQFYVDVGR